MNASLKLHHVLPFAVFLGFLLISASGDSGGPLSEGKAHSTITFYVAWYDVGKAALEGLHGVIKVERGFRGAREINTVTYDPAEITVEMMVDALTRAGTYGGTAR